MRMYRKSKTTGREVPELFMPMQKCPTMCGAGGVGMGRTGYFILLKCILGKYIPEGKIQS